MKERMALVEMLEQSELYYDAQASEANTVAMVSVCQSSLLVVLPVIWSWMTGILHIIEEHHCSYM